MTASVPPDREAAVQQVTAALSWAAISVNGQVLLTNRRIEEVADLICQAREDGRREAAEAIEARRPHITPDPHDEIHFAYVSGWNASIDEGVRVARGAQPDEKP